MANPALAMHVRAAAQRQFLTASLKVHAKAGHEIDVWWDVPYQHASEWDAQTGLLKILTSTAKSGETYEGNTYICRDCGWKELQEDCEVDYD
jgi:hypothetical protein